MLLEQHRRSYLLLCGKLMLGLLFNRHAEWDQGFHLCRVVQERLVDVL